MGPWLLGSPNCVLGPKWVFPSLLAASERCPTWGGFLALGIWCLSIHGSRELGNCGAWENVVTSSLREKLREKLQLRGSRVSAGRCWQLTAGAGKTDRPNPPPHSPGTRGERTPPCSAGPPRCLINRGTKEEKPARSCLKVIKFLRCLRALISVALCAMTLGLALGVSLPSVWLPRAPRQLSGHVPHLPSSPSGMPPGRWLQVPPFHPPGVGEEGE